MEIGSMASFRDVQVLLPETDEEVDQQAKACYAAEGALAAAAATVVAAEENDEATLQEQQDGKAPPAVPDHQEVSAPGQYPAEAPPAPVPEEHAAEAPAAPSSPEEQHGDEKDQAAVAKEDQVDQEPKAAAAADDQEESTRERLKRHRREMAGRVWVPEMWGQEKLLKDWVDCAVFDRPMVPTGLLTARRALIAECCTRRRPDRTTSSPSSSSTTSSSPLPVRNGCS